MKKKYTTLTFSIITVFFILLSFQANAQHKKRIRQHFEIGFDILPYTSQIKNDNPGFQRDWEVFFKPSMERGEFRLRFGHYNEPIHDRQLFKIVQVTDACEDPKLFKNIQAPEDFFFLNLGYGGKLKTQWFELIYGADLNLSRYKGVTIIRKIDCVEVAPGFQVEGETLIRVLEKSNYNGIGLTPFISMKVPIAKRLRFTIETGLQFNYLFGNYNYQKTAVLTDDYSVGEFEINWGKLTNDVALSYVF